MGSKPNRTVSFNKLPVYYRTLPQSSRFVMLFTLFSRVSYFKLVFPALFFSLSSSFSPTPCKQSCLPLYLPIFSHMTSTSGHRALQRISYSLLPPKPPDREGSFIRHSVLCTLHSIGRACFSPAFGGHTIQRSPSS